MLELFEGKDYSEFGNGINPDLNVIFLLPISQAPADMSP
jgi:hypothetical protein